MSVCNGNLNKASYHQEYEAIQKFNFMENELWNVQCKNTVKCGINMELNVKHVNVELALKNPTRV